MPLNREFTRAEIQHMKQVLQDYRDAVECYPEIVTSRNEDQLLIAEEILNAHTDS